jgi:hypothetical protein
MSQSKYKTFTATIETQTPLDEFAPVYISQIAKRFKRINELKKEYSEKMALYAGQLKDMKKTRANTILDDSITHIDLIFDDFNRRMKYFTMVFFGSVSAGKTSLICDLANISPRELTVKISNQPDYNPDEDEVKIGPNVATINLYEILIEKSAIRLVDVPGIGGVIHDDSSLAPFVDMADCVMFLLDANNDIMKNDEDFLSSNIANLSRRHISDKNFKIESTSDKRIVVVLNKWISANMGRDTDSTERIFEEKKKWILQGDIRNNFKGIKSYFNKTPSIVRTNTAFRNEQTGLRFDNPQNILSLDELIAELKDLLQDEGAELRLKRPILILTDEINRVVAKLEDLKIQESLESLSRDLQKLGFSVSATQDKVKILLENRLDYLATTIASNIEPQIRAAIGDWSPKVGLGNQFKMMVPSWFPGARENRLGKEETKKVLKEAWQNEIGELIKSNLSLSKITGIVRNETEVIASLVSSNFRGEFTNISPELFAKLNNLNGGIGNLDIHDSQNLLTLNGTVANLASKIENEIMNDIIGIFGVDMILGIIFNVILGPVGMLGSVIIRRIWRQGAKDREMRQEMNSAIAQTSVQVGNELKLQMSRIIREGVNNMASEYKKILNSEYDEFNKPLGVINEVLSDLRKLKEQLAQLDVA